MITVKISKECETKLQSVSENCVWEFVRTPNLGKFLYWDDWVLIWYFTVSRMHSRSDFRSIGSRSVSHWKLPKIFGALRKIFFKSIIYWLVLVFRSKYTNVLLDLVKFSDWLSFQFFLLTSNFLVVSLAQLDFYSRYLRASFSLLFFFLFVKFLNFLIKLNLNFVVSSVHAK